METKSKRLGKVVNMGVMAYFVILFYFGYSSALASAPTSALSGAKEATNSTYLFFFFFCFVFFVLILQP
jgi:hypothetical protein